MISIFENFFEIQKGVHQILFSWIPFSAGDLMYILLSIVLLYYFISLFSKQLRNSAIINMLIIVNIFYCTYQVFWGMLYFQTPIINKFSNQENINVDKAKKLALIYLEKCKHTRQTVYENKKGVFIITNLTAIQKEILNQQTKLPLYISNKKAPHILTMKPSLFRSIINFTGILGYYNPFTAEVQYNAELPHTFIPFTTAHESSHQLGFAREQEANFVGYLIGIHSTNPELRYSTEFFTLKSLLIFIVKKDSEFVKNILAHYSPAMKRDYDYEKNFVLCHQGWLNDFFGFTNNLFLKSNQQEGSLTYSYFIDLLLNYENRYKI